ncbi:Sec-independent protein translocase subunit TatB [Pseudoalteromonas sp. MMG013]|uniref:Sec-independent protein translocase protein TatB n=1 Tax=Pseudoalteromonas aurantia 208 TaxID=1314867 RepID=A0ABR9EFX0_9GAMM|nr:MULTISPECIES: Sec-independent protein translocase protein TatB [Pseudoalteromonas]MBE0369881.1 sec-independent protein translocase protein TatB [Pseudoalteromonas aurantia 208]MBQ4844837.1 Sec-independent protein translocase subunit TatB [Pseudoalteromonas sp. MMG005]MBQ4851247.1 Sec-independent protein translocase subunit TatB [Pseudoalteromonas sp. MMG012]MBQ4862128.1 Sec-independent protein translocase subunit TatB [Pseudoalteromonas sp. MMG013]
MGMWELAVVLIVGLIVLGPERLPVAIRTVSRWIKSIKSIANSVKAEVNEELRVHELHSNLKKAEQQNMTDLSASVKHSVDELNKAAASVKHSYKDNTKQSDQE